MNNNITSDNKLYDYKDLFILSDHSIRTNKYAYAQSYPDLLAIINVEKITTPFVNQPLNTSFNRILKRGFDILFSLIIIISVLSWLIPVVAVLIWIDSKGPIFFLQKRNKRNGELFTCIKFRSMIINTDADVLPAAPNDKRITRFGRFLRDHYIDELPQFFNVLLGDMSVIGPRPHMVSDNIKYQEQVAHYQYRHQIKPGITGLAQVLGYVGATENIQKIKERIGMDIFYLRHWSFKLDMLITWKTIAKPFIRVEKT